MLDLSQDPLRYITLYHIPQQNKILSLYLHFSSFFYLFIYLFKNNISYFMISKSNSLQLRDVIIG